MLTQEQLKKERERLGIPEQGVVKKSNIQSGAENIARMQLLASEFDKSKQSRLQETGQDIGQMFSNIKGRFSTAGKEMKEAESNIDQGIGSSLLQQFGAGAKAFSGSIGDLFTGAVKGLLSQDQEDAIKNKVSDVITGVVENPAVSQGIKTSIESFNKLDPTTQKNLESIFNIGMLALDIAGAGVGGKTIDTGVQTTKKAITKIGDTASDVVGKIPSLPGITGIKQTGEEILERFPRFIDKTKQKFAQSAERAERIKASSPSVQTAIKSKLDDRIINTVVDADDMTLKAYKEIVDIAGDTSKKLGIKKRPEIVAGNAVSDQYKLIENQRKNIGKQIGDAIDKLSKNKTVSMTDEINSLKRVLIDNGGTLISKNKNRAGGWVFRGKITRAEANKINELWSEIQKGSKGLSPREVRDFDQLFSKLQRETRLEGIGAIRVDTPDGNKSLFSVFRDVFSKKLDTLSPEIRTLNKEYRDVLTLMDDIDNSIIKSGNFDAAKSVDVAEFAQTNLRRMLSDAQSAAAFREIAQKLDDVARQLGYTGAKPEDLITFATEMRTLFPDAIPATSFTGGIKTGLKDMASGVLKAGTPDITDQQKALKGLIDSLLEGKQ